MGVIFSSPPQDIMSRSPLPHKPSGKRHRGSLGWLSCSHDTTVGDFISGCWENRWDSRKRRMTRELEFYDRIAGIPFRIVGKLGAGEYSEVFQAYHQAGACRQDCYAIKVYRSRALERQKRMREELSVMLKLGTYCCQIVRLHQHQLTVDDETGLMEMKLILDLCVGGTLRYRMKTFPNFNEKAVRIIALQLIQALHYLHTRRIMHCDVKPENILFMDTTGLTLKLSDFGMAKMSEDGISQPRATELTTSDVYVAPEVLSCKPYGTPADMWSLGVTLYHLLTGRLPFQKGSALNMEVCEEILSGSFLRNALSSDQFPDHLSFDALRFIERLLRIDPNERMNVIEAINHRWLRSRNAHDLPDNSTLPLSRSQPLNAGQASHELYSHSNALPLTSNCSASMRGTPLYHSQGSKRISRGSSTTSCCARSVTSGVASPYYQTSNSSLAALSTTCQEDPHILSNAHGVTKPSLVHHDSSLLPCFTYQKSQEVAYDATTPQNILYH